MILNFQPPDGPVPVLFPHEAGGDQALSQTPRSTLSATVVFISKRLEPGKKRMFPRTTRNLFYKTAKFRTPRLGGRREIFLVSVTPEGFEEKK